MSTEMKVRHTQEWDIPDLANILERAADRSNKTITQICGEARISSAFWYGLLNGRQQSIKLETLRGLCEALEIDISKILK